MQEHYDVRTADKPITERLLHDDSTDYELMEALQLSMQFAEEYTKTQNEKQKKHQEVIESVKIAFMKILKVAMFDLNVRKMYVMIEPFVKSFCESINDNDFTKHNFDELTYMGIRDMLMTLRLSTEERALLLSLFSHS